MTWLAPLLYALSAVATALAWMVVRRHPEHRPVALLLTLGLLSDVARRALTVRYTGAALHPDGAPFAGLARVAAYADAALFLAWPAALAGASVVTFLGRRAWPVAVAYVATAGAVVLTYPATRGAMLARVYTGIQLAAVMVALGCAITWYREAKVKATTAQAALSMIVSVELATLALSWRIGIFSSWHLSQIAYLILFAVLILVQGGFVWSR